MTKTSSSSVLTFPQGKTVGIVASGFHDAYVTAMVHACLEVLRNAGAPQSAVVVERVPGAWEIPLACQRMARTKKVDAIVALGVIIKGVTDHYSLIASECASGVMRVSLREDVPIVFEVLAADTEQKIIDRVADDEYNKGRAAAHTALRVLGN